MRAINQTIAGALGFISMAVPAAFSADLTVSSFSSFAGQTNILLQATGNVIFTGGSLSLPALPSGASTGQLSVQAANDILIQNGTSLSAGQGWSVSFLAGANLNVPGTVSPGVGNITLEGSASLASDNGPISLLAGNSVAVGTGFVHTTGGGGINVTTELGDVNSGTSTSGFNYLTTAPYCTPSPTLGGISTAAGGDVNITAAGNATSYFPIGTGASGDAGTGAFGSQPGNVTIQAGASVFGHFVVVNGTGTITAGQGDIGNSSQNVALSLVAGSWSLNAPNGDVYLQEVRNPNGVFNTTGRPNSGGNHLFNYDPNASVFLAAGDGVYLTGFNRPRTSDAVNLPVLLPPTLNITAGVGGVNLENNATLFPSPDGDLQLTTTNGGAFAGVGSGSATLLMSDSAQTHWFVASSGPQPFSASDHAAVPVELTNVNPASIDIDGGMTNVVVQTSKQTQITVEGDMNGCGFSGQNLSSNDVTSLSAIGDILNNSPAAGYVINGPGTLNVTAQNLAIGGSAGIESVGPLNNHALAPLALSSADIHVSLSGNLDMPGAAISSIAGGSISVNAQGYIDLGSTNFPPTNNVTRGIFTSLKADVSVIAGGDINLNGSRIAAYDGGNILLGSVYGNIDASDSGTNWMTVTEVFGDPVQTSTAVIYGNGLLASTFPTSAQIVGNITALAAHDILLGCGAITQLPLNGSSRGAPTITLQAGGEVEVMAISTNCISVDGADIVNILATAPVFLSAQVNTTNLTAVAGTNIQLTVTAAGLAPLTCQWFKNGSPLPGDTDVSLSLTNIDRTDAGTYSIVISNIVGAVTNDIDLQVLVPQRLSISFAQTNQILSVSFADADGGQLSAQDISSFVIQTSTDLVDWTVTNLPVSTNASGGLSFDLPASPGLTCDFYRILSQ
ncbi:MAG: immunoglobulin domain-containing protein [Verrucomicrobiota bacterium]|jgi:hypothetical protein